MTKPDFLNSKGERKIKSKSITVDSIEWHYRDILRGLFVWKGLPDDIPTGFIDADALYVASGFALKDVKGLGLCGFPCNPVLVNIYGAPSKWLAQPYGWATDKGGAGEIDAEIFTQSDAPVLWIRASIRDRVLPYIQIMARAMQSLGNNITALNHPTLIRGVASGSPGDNIGSILIQSELEDGSTYIPVVAPSAMGLETLDLGVQDSTQNLCSVIDWCDARILEIIGASTGVEKSSGITTLETSSGIGGMGASNDAALLMRKAWCDKVNATFGTSITVERSEVIDNIIAGVTNGNNDDSDIMDSENIDTETEID